MQFISSRQLIDNFRNCTFDESQVGPYFLAHMILSAASSALAFGHSSIWNVPQGLAIIVITIFGVLHLKKRNGDTFGELFVYKYLCLGWIVTVRMTLLAVPTAVVLVALCSIMESANAIHPAKVIISIAYTIVYYWWIGILIAQSNDSRIKSGSAAD